MPGLEKKVLERLGKVEKRYIELENLISLPEVIKDRERYMSYLKERGEIQEIIDSYRRYRDLLKQYEEAKSLLESNDEELRVLAKDELKRLEEELEVEERRIRKLLVPPDPMDERNILLEIRAGAGGEEAALFAADLLRMYMRYAERKGWRTEILSANRTGLRGFKEVIALIEGKGAYSRLKYESGVHRVQRIPITESSGRIHTSTCTVAILPEPQAIEVKIDPDELKIETFRASGHGGQHVNKTESAVRITHIPTGIVVQCQDEKSQHKNRERAMKILYMRLKQKMEEEQEEKIKNERRSQVGRGERSEKIRTYNFPQNRVTDHRINFTVYNLPEIMDGDLDELIDRLIDHFNSLALAETS